MISASYEEWSAREVEAREYMEEVASRPGVLIEVAAQHPLLDRVSPNEEFGLRLDLGEGLYRKFTEEGKEVKIYVPGSRHSEDGIDDEVSLSVAGARYLIDKGVPGGDIFSDDANEKYKPEEGVYNSSDECFVASELFRDLGFGDLHCVCSPIQVARKALSYIAFGVMPVFHTVSARRMFHNFADETFLYVPRLLEDGTGLQGEGSAESQRLRDERVPRT